MPGNTYTFPIMDGNNSFDEESADIWSITASEYTPKGEKEKFSSVEVSKGSDGDYYLTVKVKQNRDTYYDAQDAYILLKVKEKGLSKAEPGYLLRCPGRLYPAEGQGKGPFQGG